jgi:hypothetical protein
METVTRPNGPEDHFATDLLEELDRNRRPLDTIAKGLAAAHRTSEFYRGAEAITPEELRTACR